MLPPDFAAFSFQTDAAGGDDALAQRAVAAMGADGRIAVAGAARWGLLLALARRGAHVVAFDPSRLVLSMARDAAKIADLEDRVTLFAADPRDVTVPGGVDAALVTSFMWRVLLTREAQSQTLECLGHAVGTGALCLDVDRLPTATPRETEETPLRDGPGGQRWTWRRDPARSLVTVKCEAPRVGPIEVALSDITPEASVHAVEQAGFDARSSDADTGAAFGPASPRLWLVARPK